ncbi:MAG: prepilin-type N-terminal cleavage/methylation domain-containing protein [Desulfurivibrionaceae bacterium]|nr:prepilin-type N-terminal cleavage/methylation domain-containing protein [Desulfurivibrionaceae bacterium]
MQLHRDERGFTLIEMIIVIMLLGLLSSMAIPYYLDMQKEAKIAAVKGKLAAIRGGIELAHAKILVSGVNTGPTGDNPDWPTLEEVRSNALVLDTRPEPLRNLRLVRTNDFSTEAGHALPTVNLPDMTSGMAARPAGVTERPLHQAIHNPRIADETTGWAYYPGDERDANGQTMGAIFYINDDRAYTDNVDGSGRVPANF